MKLEIKCHACGKFLGTYEGESFWIYFSSEGELKMLSKGDEIITIPNYSIKCLECHVGLKEAA